MNEANETKTQHAMLVSTEKCVEFPVAKNVLLGSMDPGHSVQKCYISLY